MAQLQNVTGTIQKTKKNTDDILKILEQEDGESPLNLMMDLLAEIVTGQRMICQRLDLIESQIEGLKRGRRK